jgi:GntR family transcriptional regulator / MocR family aminotransferase
MGKSETFQDLSLDPPADGEELGHWLYSQLQAAILDGRLKPGARMPSTRNLAQQYRVARGTVTTAFDALRSEGYLDARVGAGTFVAVELPETSIIARPVATASVRASRASLSRRGQEMIRGVKTLPASRSLGKAFRSYEPAIDLFPVNLWSRVAGRVLRRAPRSSYGQGDPRGYLPLRKAIAEYVGATRSVRCTAAQIIVTSGAQQALELVTRMLVDRDDKVWMEDPGYPGARFALQAGGTRIVPVPVDEEGMMVSAARILEPKARLAYVTPSNQFPLGVTLSTERRQELLTWASEENSWIIEDEFDAEYRYFSQLQPSLQSQDQSGCVIYVGTFTKMLFNSLRLGFVVAPERIADALTTARTLYDRHPPTLEQAILAEFILDGHFGHHVRRMRQIYAERSESLCENAKRYLSGCLAVTRADAGMRTTGRIGTGQCEREILDRARGLGLEVAGISEFTTDHSYPGALVLGFAGCTPAELKRGCAMLARAFEQPGAAPA